MIEASGGPRLRPALARTRVRISEAITRAVLACIALAVWIGRGVDLGVATLQLVDVTGLVLILLAMAISGKAADRMRPRTPLVNSFLTLILVAISLIIATGLLSALNAVDVGAVARFTLRYILGLLLVASLVVLLDRPGRVRVLVKWLLLGAVLSVGISILGLILPSVAEITLRYGDRSQALMNHPNQLAMLLTTVLPIAIAVAMGHGRRVNAWLVVLVIAGGIAMTGSKLNLGLLALGVLAYLLLVALTYPRLLVRLKALLRVTAATVVLVGMAVAVMAYVTPRTINTVVRLLTEPAEVSAVVSRLELWQTAFQLGWENPLVGIGAANAQYFLPFHHAHNVFMEFLMTLGFTGLLALTLFLLVLAGLASTSVVRGVFNRALSQYSRLMLIAVPFASALYVAANQSSDSFGGTTLPVLWLVVALNLAVLNHARSMPDVGRRSQAKCNASAPQSE